MNEIHFQKGSWKNITQYYATCMCPLLLRSRNTVEVFNLQIQYKVATWDLLQVKESLYVFWKYEHLHIFVRIIISDISLM